MNLSIDQTATRQYNVSFINDEYQSINYGLLIKAISFATHKHRNQRRKDSDATPYINHPVSLVNILANDGGISDLNILIAAILHDTIEDTETSCEELKSEFGKKITSIVLEVTDDKNLPKAEQKQKQIDHAPFISHEAKLIKLADKISNLQDTLLRPPVSWTIKRKIQYFDWAQDVVNGLRGVNPKLEKLFDKIVAKKNSILTEPK